MRASSALLGIVASESPLFSPGQSSRVFVAHKPQRCCCASLSLMPRINKLPSLFQSSGRAMNPTILLSLSTPTTRNQTSYGFT